VTGSRCRAGRGARLGRVAPDPAQPVRAHEGKVPRRPCKAGLTAVAGEGGYREEGTGSPRTDLEPEADIWNARRDESSIGVSIFFDGPDQAYGKKQEPSGLRRLPRRIRGTPRSGRHTGRAASDWLPKIRDQVSSSAGLLARDRGAFVRGQGPTPKGPPQALPERFALEEIPEIVDDAPRGENGARRSREVVIANSERRSPRNTRSARCRRAPKRAGSGEQEGG